MATDGRHRSLWQGHIEEEGREFAEFQAKRDILGYQMNPFSLVWAFKALLGVSCMGDTWSRQAITCGC